jgi:hypothetical protein
MKRAGLIFFLLALPAALVLWGQQNAGQHPALPTITFDRVWEAYKPQNINITVQSAGSAKYLSRNPFTPPDPGSDPDYTLDFTLSARNQERLFRDAREANYFNGDFSYKKHAVATTGKKTLTYADPNRYFETSYDYSENRAIEEITNIFAGISNTIEHGRKLQFLHRFDKLGLEDELKGMEAAMESHNLAELQIIQPTLESIAGDAAVLNIARQRAKKLLAKANSE